MPTLPTSQPSSINHTDSAVSFCYVKEAWDDDWEFVPFLYCTRCAELCPPEMSHADLVYNTGELMQEDSSVWEIYDPIELIGQFVRIDLQYPGYAPVPVWFGVITDDKLAIQSATTTSGPQPMRAYGLGHLLDRVELRTGHCFAGTDGTDEIDIDDVPTFNFDSELDDKVLGNRSLDVDSEDVYRFAAPGDSSTRTKWDAQNIIKHMLAHDAPDEIEWQLAGQTEALIQIERVFTLNGHKLWQSLNELIDRRHGIGWYLRTTGEGPVQIWVFTVVEEDVSYATGQLDANAAPVHFTIPSTYPYNHLADTLEFRRTRINQFGTLVYRSERMKSMAAFSKADETFEAGWSSGLESGYKQASGGDDPKVNDRYRSLDQYRRVFTTQVVPKTWDGMVKDGENALDARPMFPTPLDDGTFDEETPAPFWAFKKKFERSTLLKEAWNYAPADGPTDQGKTDRVAELRPIYALIKDTVQTANAKHTKDGKWHLVDKLDQGYQGQARALHVRPLDTELGVEVGGHPPHYLAAEDWAGAKASETEPEFTWRQIIVVGAMKSDVRARVVIELSEESEQVLTVDCKEVEVWYCVPGTPIDVTTAGNIVMMPPENRWIRDDTDKLHARAALGKAWFGVERQCVEIPLNRPGLYVPLGSMLTGVSGAYAWVPVRTVITARMIDFESQRTTISTGWGALDFAPEPVA